MFIDLRITPKFIEGYADVPEEWNLATWWGSIRNHFKPERWILGKEELDKFGAKTHLHYHINMGECDIECGKDAMQKWIRTNLCCKGNKCYSIRVMGDLDDEARWWRYPLKQKGVKIHGFEKQDIATMSLLAIDEYNQTAARNIKTRAKLENKSQFRDKLHAHLKERHQHVRGRCALYVLIAKYYQECGNVPPTGKLYDCVIDYLTIIGHMTWEEHFARHHIE